MSRFPSSRDDLPAVQQAVWDEIAASRGKVPAPYLPLLASPTTALAFERFSTTLWASSLNVDEQELVYLVVAKAWGCAHQWRTHEPKARQAGVPDALIVWVASNLVGDPPLAPSDRLVVIARLVQTLQRPGPVHDEVFAQAAAQLEPRRLSDLLAFAALAAAIAMLLNAG